LIYVIKVKAPGTFTKMLIMEPILYPTVGPKEHIMAIGALRRRNEWTSLKEVEEYYKPKTFFAKWDPRVLSSYINNGFYQDTNKGTWHLRCQPTSESRTFMGLQCTGTFIY